MSSSHSDQSDIPPPLPRAGGAFASQAATASLLAPLVVIAINVVLNIGLGGQTARIAKLLLGSVSILLIVAGFALGIVALSGARRVAGRSTCGKAIVGTCINGILITLMLLSIPALRKASMRAKEMRQQQIYEHQMPQP